MAQCDIERWDYNNMAKCVEIALAQLTKPVSQKAIEDAVLDAVNFIQDLQPFPHLSESDWVSLTDDGDKPATGTDSAGARELYSAYGVGIFDFTVFLVLVAEFPGKPPGFAKVAKASLNSSKILKALFTKVDHRIADNKISKVELGFLTFLGMVWFKSGKNTSQLTLWLQTLFAPLVKAAGAAYVANWRAPPPPTQESEHNPLASRRIQQSTVDPALEGSANTIENPFGPGKLSWSELDAELGGVTGPTESLTFLTTSVPESPDASRASSSQAEDPLTPGSGGAESQPLLPLLPTPFLPVSLSATASGAADTQNDIPNQEVSAPELQLTVSRAPVTASPSRRPLGPFNTMNRSIVLTADDKSFVLYNLE
ncbi:hypothetical protein B0H19DRAFT_1061199 [Mycena capillaripes]|nr:hypothetical protein B0H19DRAFT_1061199 [Mycena capillaripes]